MPKTLFLFCVLAFSLSACSPKLTSSVSTNTPPAAKNKMLFLNLEVSKSSPTPTFRVISHSLANGRIKKPTPTTLNTQHFFKIIFNNESGDAINQIAVENPLNRIAEVPAENGTFSRQQLDLDQASLAIRIQYLFKIGSISIFDETGKLVSTLEVSI